MIEIVISEDVYGDIPDWYLKIEPMLSSDNDILRSQDDEDKLAEFLKPYGATVKFKSRDKIDVPKSAFAIISFHNDAQYTKLCLEY